MDDYKVKLQVSSLSLSTAITVCCLNLPLWREMSCSLIYVFTYLRNIIVTNSSQIAAIERHVAYEKAGKSASMSIWSPYILPIIPYGYSSNVSHVGLMPISFIPFLPPMPTSSRSGQYSDYRSMTIQTKPGLAFVLTLPRRKDILYHCQSLHVICLFPVSLFISVCVVVQRSIIFLYVGLHVAFLHSILCLYL